MLVKLQGNKLCIILESWVLHIYKTGLYKVNNLETKRVISWNCKRTKLYFNIGLPWYFTSIDLFCH